MSIYLPIFKYPFLAECEFLTRKYRMTKPCVSSLSSGERLRQRRKATGLLQHPVHRIHTAGQLLKGHTEG